MWIYEYDLGKRTLILIVKTRTILIILNASPDLQCIVHQYCESFDILETQIYPVIQPPDIPSNLLIATIWLYMKYIFYIKPLNHLLYCHPPGIISVQTRLFHKEKWIGCSHKRSCNQWRNNPVITFWLMLFFMLFY